MSRVGVVFLLAACVQMEACAGGAEKSELQRIEASLTHAGPKQTLKTYFDCSHPEGYALIETGDPRALEIATELLKVSDACNTESLMSALATAMQKNPDAVLAHMPDIRRLKLDPGNFCVPFLDADDTSRADALAVIARSERAVSKVSKPELQDARRTCLAAFRKFRQDLDAAEAFRKRQPDR